VEMQRYVTVCRRWWWIVLVALLATIVSTIALLGAPTREYESTASFVIQPQALEEGDQVRALDALVQGGTVGETYASIARSKLVRARAAESLTPREQAQHMVVSAEVVTGTRIIRLTVRSKDPVAARHFAGAVSRETVAYVNGLADNYRLDPLDSPTRPTHALPTKRSVTLALAGILGLMLGVALAFFADHLWSARKRRGPASPERPEHADMLWTPAPMTSDGMSIAHNGGPQNHWPVARKRDVDSPA
jgi:capsular polysaccharide biosynthesis protein